LKLFTSKRKPNCSIKRKQDNSWHWCYLVVPEKAGLDILAVNLPVDVPDLEVAELPQHALHTRHDVVDETAFIMFNN
jgi:hypothetical protein